MPMNVGLLRTVRNDSSFDQHQISSGKKKVSILA